MRSKVFVLVIVVVLKSSIGFSQTIPSTDVILSRPDSVEMVKLGGTNIGFMRSRRGIIRDDASGQRLVGATEVNEQDPLGPTRPGIVYNYSMQLYGLVSGELSFELRPGADARALNWARTTPPELLVPPSVYLVRVVSGAEFLRVFTMLQTSADVRWVEPAIRYIPEAIE
jgi:hypothetical protein